MPINLDGGRNIHDAVEMMAFPPDNPRGEYVWTFTGKRFYFDSPDDGICIKDIAHALSQLCRWTGHTKKFYSVAQHCVLVSQLVPKEYKLRALLHDAAEAYTNDINKPLKNLLGSNLKRYEQTTDAAIYKHFGLGPMTEEERKVVKNADIGVAMAEAEYLLGQTSIVHYEGVKNPYKSPCDARMDLPWNSHDAKQYYLSTFTELI